MSGLLDKSKKNRTAAELLLKQSLPDSSVHCSYYACAQHMLHVLFFKNGIDQTAFYAEARNNKQGTHGWAAKQIELALGQKSREDFKWFQRTFKEFKLLREKADYQVDAITVDEGLTALSKSDSISNLLTQHFK